MFAGKVETMICKQLTCNSTHRAPTNIHNNHSNYITITMTMTPMTMTITTTITMLMTMTPITRNG